MEEPSLAKKNSEDMKSVYLKRRLTLFGALVAILIIAVLFLVLTSDIPMMPEPELAAPLTDAPIYEKKPQEPEPIINVTQSTVEACEIEAPLEYLGCLELNDQETIFEAYGMRPDDDNVEDVVKVVNKKCNTDLPVDRDCIVRTVFTESENSWACEWECLEDMASCPSYKTHLAVAVLRQYVPATDAFVGRTDDFDFFMLYKDNEGQWIQPQYIALLKPEAETLYNDIYHAGPMDEVVYPEVIQVEPGDEFCFDVYSSDTCVCKVNVESFPVGDCPELPADLRGICDQPVTEIYITPGLNPICFEVSDDADEELYTYKFSLGESEDHWFAGSALITTTKYDCCVNASFEGFLEVED
jgi:hypothetical protein